VGEDGYRIGVGAQAAERIKKWGVLVGESVRRRHAEALSFYHAGRSRGKAETESVLISLVLFNSHWLFAQR
jgi:hypothetical protein